MARKILVISNSLDAHSDDVEAALTSSGSDVIRLNSDKMGDGKTELVFRDSHESSGIRVGGDYHSFCSVDSVWYRRPETPVVDIRDPYQKKFAEAEMEALLRQAYYSLNHALWVSRVSALEGARPKLSQLTMAKRHGLRVPRTLATNSPEEVREFLASIKGRAVYKTLYRPVIRLGEGPDLWGIPTTILQESHIEGLELVRQTGGIFQEYIEKQYELRVTVIGKDVFSSRIDSQLEPTAKVDWREAVALGKVSIQPYNLPPAVEKACKGIVDDYGLNFGAIDLVRTPSGEYVFLEINCNGQWLWVEEVTGQPLLDSMVRLLTLSQ